MPRPPRPLQPERSPTDWLGAEIRHWREHPGPTQHELTQRVWVSTSLIGRIETAERTCSPELARHLNEALDTGGVLVRALRLITATRKHTPSETAKGTLGEIDRGTKSTGQRMLDDVERRNLLKAVNAAPVTSPLLAFSPPQEEKSHSCHLRVADIDQVRDAALGGIPTGSRCV